MGHIVKAVFGVAAMSALTFGLTSFADAGACKGRHCKHGRSYDQDGVYRYVTAEASIGGKAVTAPVRPGKWGDEVRTPGGNWVDCEITCEYTLRRLTVDFWDGMGQNHMVSPRYFRFEYDLDTNAFYRKHYD